MKNVTVHLVQLPEAARETAMQAARQVFPRVQFATARTVAEAARLPVTGLELLVFGGAEEADMVLAAQTVDAGDLPRWAVLCHGRAPEDLVEVVPPEEWNVRVLARIFRSLMLQQELLRENLQLRGDLKTIVRRLSHDIRTPLGCIHTGCELLRDPSGSPEMVEETLEVIRNATGEVGQLLDRVNFVLKATIDPLPVATVAMGPIVGMVLKELQPAIDHSGKRVRPPATWPEVEGVASWLEVIWGNLIGNALRHGAKTGSVQLGWDQQGGDVRCWIANPGTVPPAYRPRLLRRFHLLHQDASGGLGLSLVERLVALQHGRCGYESTDDGRSVFYFTLRGAGENAGGVFQPATLAGNDAS
jgi:signal transduction histidine kinase